MTRHDKLMELYNEGYTDKKMAELCNTSRGSIFNWRKKNGLDSNSISKKIVFENIKDDLIRLHSLGFTDKQISEEIKCSVSYVNYWRGKLNLKINGVIKRRVYLKDVRDSLIRLHDDGLGDLDIAEKLNCTKQSVYEWRRQLNLIANNAKTIDKQSEINSRYLEGFDHHAFVGSCLGDGSLSKCRGDKLARGSFAHSIKQVDYFDHKVDLFEPLLSRDNIRIRICRLHNKEHKVKSVHFFSSRYLDNLYNKIYIHDQNHTFQKKRGISEDILKEYNDISLAYHYMDDGGLTHNNYMIYTLAFSKEEVEMFCQKIMLDKFNIQANIRKDNSIYIPAKHRSDFYDIISPYIIPSMLYKTHLHI